MPRPLSEYPIIIADRNGVIQVWSQQAEVILGYPASFAIGQTLDIIIPESSRPGHWQAFNKVMNIENFQGKEDVTDARFLCQNGQLRLFNLRLIALRDIQGNAIGAMNIIDPDEIKIIE